MGGAWLPSVVGCVYQHKAGEVAGVVIRDTQGEFHICLRRDRKRGHYEYEIMAITKDADLAKSIKRSLQSRWQKENA